MNNTVGDDGPQRLRGNLVRWATAGLMCAALALLGCSQQSSTPALAIAPLPLPKVKLGPVVGLTTQWYPDTAQNEDETENRLLREIVRQGVLISLREELGLVTRDETLEELLPPKAAPASETSTADSPAPAPDKPFELWLEVLDTGAWEASLFGAGAVRENPVWRNEGTFEFDKRTIYAQFSAQMADACEPIAEKLRAAGAVGKARPLNPDNVPGPEIETLLGQMNFVSQYAAVRAAHTAMREKGPSVPWMGVLVRGYGHLAMLTDHLWSSQHEAFAARSLLYAERMVRQSNDDDLAKWHRAYARAVIGAHGSALDQLEELKSPKEAASADSPEKPAWAALLKPYLEGDGEALAAAAQGLDDLTETAAVMGWQLNRSYRHGRWIYERGGKFIQACPEAYGVYSVMANWDALMVKRLGSAYGIATFGSRLPERVAELDDLPEAARAHTVKPNPLLSRFWRDDQDAGPNPRPMKVARALRVATESDDSPDECSWAILGGLIAEEQFVEAADVLRSSRDATEHSDNELVEALMPLVEDHRYAAYIKSHMAPRADAAQIATFVQEMDIVDPRDNMQQLFRRIWHIPTARGQNGNLLAWRAIWARNFTQFGLLESYYGTAENWPTVTAEHRQKFASDFRKVSPHWSSARRLQWETATDYEPAQLAKWEAELKEDPGAWLTLGNAYYAKNDFNAAIRCYKRSLEISPSFNATQFLAYAYREVGKPELWQPTLESYLKELDLSLSHSQIHQLIADDCILRRAWAEAEPHVLDAAQTYSASGLMMAGRVYEGMQEWEKSEHFVAEAARNYPSYSTGTEWYAWCRRTGRGDLDAAKEIAERNVAIAEKQVFPTEAYRVFVYRLLENQLKEAVAGVEQQLTLSHDPEDKWWNIWRKLHMLVVAERLDDESLKTQSLADIHALIDSDVKTEDPKWYAVVDGICRIAGGEKLDDAYFKSFDETLAAASTDSMCNYAYLMGAALDLQGDDERSDVYLRRAAFGGAYSSHGATLAGAELVKRHGAGRGGIPEEFAKLETAEAEKFREKQAREAAESEDGDDSSEDDPATETESADTPPDNSI